MVELAQVRGRQHDAAHRCGLLGVFQRRRRRGRGRAAPHAQQDRLDVVTRFATACLDHTLNLVDGVLFQQLQDTDEVLDAAAWTMLSLQGFA